ncbi:MAG: site-specific integrase [Rikenellaceae bacterium]
MATVTAFIRVSTKKVKKANVRFRLRDGRKMQLLFASDIEVNPEYWDSNKQELKAKILYDTAKRAEFNKSVADIKNIILNIYNSAPIKESLTSDWLKDEIDKALHPEKYDLKEKQKTFFETYDYFLESRKISEVRKRNFRVIYRALQRYELYKRLTKVKGFSLSLDTITPETLRDIEQFLSNEYKFFEEDENGKLCCNNEYRPIYEAIPESRTPQQRGQNTLNDIFTKLRTFFLWAIEIGKTTNNPFKNFAIEECVYGTPYYITIDERNKLFRTNLSRHPKLAIQRDIFVFQCLIGCRVGDLYKFTRNNVINGAIEYIPRKTKEGRPVTVRVPLNSISKEILERYSDIEGLRLFPFISEQKYNIAIKRIFLAAGLTRPVTIINPTTREPEVRPINEMASSHLARRCFVGNLYKQVKDPNLVGALSGHKEGSKAFARYREIDEGMKQDLVNLLE